ncbi:MAG TPA: DUF4215 domain-containing protein [Myxococcota bacterium]|nr:DUF4215 domain-containing protein [Myxococcota bacterium]HRY92837.1 DUF4215 domain-containing protein [Myxococcota bacterium]HSA20282.1 DUF4215 domain-containing protein [Myxococcota bacterium]
MNQSLSWWGLSVLLACSPFQLTCDGGSGALPECGNQQVEAGEVCDDGRNGDACDGCLDDCTALVNTCGDGYPCGAEECDDHNTTGGDGCSANCANEVIPACGDGIPQAGEDCDDGRDGDSCDGCLDDCTSHSNTCGDGFRCDLEECDDHNTTDGDGCSALCLDEVLPSCGDGTPDNGEDCDDGRNGDDCDGCLDDCTSHSNTCGDGYRCDLEECDDHNTTDGDGCSALCLDEILPACGNGTPEAGEGCDDGNGVLTDDCPDGPGGSCEPAYCGDGFTNLSGPARPVEGCDDGNLVDADACSNACQPNPSCGIDQDADGSFLDPGEGCDLGPQNSATTSGDCASACRPTCVCPACGDGVVDYPLGEECDDGGGAAGDGCDGLCRVEVTPACGDGHLDAYLGEECDDGATAPGDGCSPTCQLEPVGQTCGDQVQDALEACDDGGACADGSACSLDADCAGQPTAPPSDDRCLPRNGDGCNATCTLTNAASTFHLLTGGVTLEADNTYLWMAQEGSGILERLDIQACIQHLAANPCLPGPPPTCAQPCPTQQVTTSAISLALPASDGRTLWFTESAYQVSMVVRALDIAACDAALALGGDCSALVQDLAGGPWGHMDGVGAAARFGEPRGLTYHHGALYLLDSGCGTLRRIDPVSGTVVTVVGPAQPTCPSPGALEGYGAAARLASPRYMATDNSGFLYVSDNFDHGLWRYHTASGYLERFVGTGVSGYLDALDGRQAQFARPRDIASDGTSLFVADFNNYVLREVHLTTRRVTTLLGQAGACGSAWGTGALARLDKPMTLVFHHPSRSVFVYTASDCGSAPQIWRVR